MDRGKTRVAGPFTVEQIPTYGIDLDEPATYDPDALADDDRSDDIRRRGGAETDPVRSISELVDLLRIDGVRLPGGRHLQFLSLAPTSDGGQIHAEGEYEEAGERQRIAVSFGPLHGPIGARQVEDVLREAVFAPYHASLFTGFAIDGSAQSFIQNYRTPKGLTLMMANIAADVLVPDLLKSRRGQQLFAVFGEPDVELRNVGAGEWQVEVRGMDVYDPATGAVQSRHARRHSRLVPGSGLRPALVPRVAGILPGRRHVRPVGTTLTQPARLGRPRRLRDAARNRLPALQARP